CRTARPPPATRGWAASRRPSRPAWSWSRRRCGRSARAAPSSRCRACYGARPPRTGGTRGVRRAGPGRSCRAAPAPRSRCPAPGEINADDGAHGQVGGDGEDKVRGRTVTRLTDPRALRAYAHPVRMALMGLLRTEGPLTATRAAELLGESSGTCSFHLRQLARYGLVEEAGGGTGREKP